jgi:hypothetical protein
MGGRVARTIRPAGLVAQRGSGGAEIYSTEGEGDAQAGGGMPSFFMRNCSVPRLRPKRSAALPWPAIFQSHSSTTLRMWALDLLEPAAGGPLQGDARGIEEEGIHGKIRARRGDHRSLDDVVHLADVPGPGMGHECLHQGIGYAFNPPAQRSAHPGDEMPVKPAKRSLEHSGIARTT